MIAAKKKNTDVESEAPRLVVPVTIERKTIYLDKLIDSAFNPRKVFDKTKLEELGQSMRATGQLQPILVRPSPTRVGFYEIAAGHRRKRAAHLAGFEELEAIVRELSDEDMIVIGITENKDREDLPPLEEAFAYKALVERGWSVEKIADRAGKSEALVRRRLRLTHLCQSAQDAVAAGWLLAGAAVLLSRLESLEDQAAVIEHVKDRQGEGEVVDSDELSYSIEQFMRKLSGAPFDIGDVDLVATAGACTSCPKRTQAQAVMFAEPQALDDEDRCTDGACWGSKVAAHSLVQIEKAKAKGQRVVDDKAARKEKIVDERGHLDYGYVPVEQKTWASNGKETTKAKLMESAGVEFTPITVLVDGVATDVVPRKIFEKAQKALDSEHSGASASNAGGGRSEAEAMKAEIDGMRNATVNGVRFDVHSMRALFSLAAHHASFDAMKAMAQAYGFTADGSYSSDIGDEVLALGDVQGFTAEQWLKATVHALFPHSHPNAHERATEVAMSFARDDDGEEEPAMAEAFDELADAMTKPKKAAKKKGGKR